MELVIEKGYRQEESVRDWWLVHSVIINLDINEQTLLPISQLSHLDHTNDQGDYS